MTRSLPRTLLALLLLCLTWAGALTPNDLIRLTEAGQYRQAQQGLDAAEQARGVSQKSLEVQALIDQRTGLGERALHDLQQSRKLSATHTLSGILSAAQLTAIQANAPLGPVGLDRAIRAGYAKNVLDDLETLNVRYPDRVEVHVLYAQAAVATGNLTLARSQLALARHIDPDLTAFTPAAVATLDQALGTRPSTDAHPETATSDLRMAPAGPQETPGSPVNLLLLLGLPLLALIVLTTGAGLWIRRRTARLEQQQRAERRAQATELLREHENTRGPAVLDLRIRAENDLAVARKAELYQTTLAELERLGGQGLLSPEKIQDTLQKLDAATFSTEPDHPAPVRTGRTPASAQEPSAQERTQISGRRPQTPRPHAADTGPDVVLIQPSPVVVPISVPYPVNLPERSTVDERRPDPALEQSSFQQPEREQRWNDAPTQTPDPTPTTSFSSPSSDTWSSPSDTTPSSTDTPMSTGGDSW